MKQNLFPQSETSLDVVVLTPSSIPPPPESGVVLRGTARATSSASSPALPCAAFWSGGAAAETLRTSQVMSVAADELDWLYENTDDETDPSCIQARAAIEGWMSELSIDHQLAIAMHHDPTPWPEELSGHEEDSFALVLLLLCPADRRSQWCMTPVELELRARRRLEIRLEREGARGLTTLIRRARWLFEEAVRAYAMVRGRVPSVVPVMSACFASSSDEDASV